MSLYSQSVTLNEGMRLAVNTTLGMSIPSIVGHLDAAIQGSGLPAPIKNSQEGRLLHAEVLRKNAVKHYTHMAEFLAVLLEDVETFRDGLADADLKKLIQDDLNPDTAPDEDNPILANYKANK
jgi:carboxylesterase type B